MTETARKSFTEETLLPNILVENQEQPQLIIRILKEPLLHFLILGALLFALYFAVGDTSISSTSPRQIEVSPPVIESLKTTWKQQWGSLPNQQQLQTLLDNYIRDEILYQEALSLGLDQKDVIVRRRLIQKMQFLMEDVAALREPSDEVLQAYLAEHVERYTIPGKVSFSQIYLSRELRGDRTDTDAQAILTQLQSNPNLDLSEIKGDRSMLPTSYTLASASTLANTFGGSFGREMAQVTETGWQGPFHSVYGSHLVNVTQIEPSHPPTLDEVKKKVRLDWFREERQKQNEQFYQKLRDRYTVSLDQDALNQAL
ncbi:MAG: peptidylprolyl isomerase [Nostocaceae cyanobacterium]|nr:peptidylprolyl isomerase [Nostocaceae cyanobacterium]